MNVGDTPKHTDKGEAMKKQNEVVPRKRLTLEEQYRSLATALYSATANGNTQAINGLAIMLKGYEEAIKEANHRADELASGTHPDVYEASRKWNI